MRLRDEPVRREPQKVLRGRKKERGLRQSRGRSSEIERVSQKMALKAGHLT